MKLKDRIKTYNFWLSLAGAIYLIISSIGKRFDFSIDQNLYNDIFTSICSIFVLLGIISGPPKQGEEGDTCNSPENQLDDKSDFDGGALDKTETEQSGSAENPNNADDCSNLPEDKNIQTK